MSTFIYMAIEAIIFLIPLASLFIKVGHYKKELEEVVEKTKDLPQWKAVVDSKVTQLELQTIEQQHTLESINNSIITISTKMDLLLDSKIKINDK